MTAAASVVPASAARWRPLQALFAKEWDQHGRVVLLLTGFLTAFWLLAWLAHERAARSVSALEIVPEVATWALPALALLLGHRLVVEEYYGRTQRFLEALPLVRGQEAAVKLGVGLLCLLTWAALTLGATLLLARGHEPLGGRFVLLLGVRLAGFVIFLWALVFLFFCCGRVRLPLLALAAVLLVLISSRAETPLTTLGPFALLDARTYVVERVTMPWRALAWSLGLAALAVTAAFALVRLRDGSIMESLARPLSLREKAAIATLLAGGLTAWAGVERRKPTTLPALTTDKVLRSPGLHVAYFTDELLPAAERLAALVTPALAELRPILAAPAPLRLVHGADLLPERPQFAAFNPDGGLVVRLNFQVFLGGEPTQSQEALAAVLHYYINAAAGEAVSVEPRHWLLDGYALLLAERAQRRGSPAPQIDLILDATMAAGAALARPLPSADDLFAYHRLVEQVGELPASAIAASGWRHLERTAGTERVTALARAAFGRTGTRDVRDRLHQWRWPVDRLFTQATGIDHDQFLVGWRRWLAAEAAQPARARWLAALPQVTVEVALSRDDLDAITVRGRLPRAAPPATDCSLLHALEPWYDTIPNPDNFTEDKITLPAGGSSFAAPVEGDYESGERAFVALECRAPATPWGVRLFAGRVTVP
jgi:hypothetical protein